MTTTTSTAAFPAELRRWRANRRLSQLELADRAGTTQRHLSFMESGRSHPGAAIVLRLAESLELGLRERNALLLSAGYAPRYPESGLGAPILRPVREALDRILAGHLPYPALIAGPHGELVAANPAFDLLTEGAAAELLRPPVNVYRLALHPDGMARRVVNLADWGRHITENMHARARRRQDPELAALAAELAALLPPAAAAGDPLGFAVPLHLRTPAGDLRLLTTLTTFATATDVTVAELHLEAFLPADEATAELLRARYD
ncbi:helix-turn-helix domain-containing protein [Kitasatospora viridis]|uniref:Xre family transcriptional regulator n=1 Tax=Kitasatospora viridis TaxID=281105 RepID=A0A561ULH8_9ACTN|nr:helix-turn-helix domain-containing protein [Kitasatospora viridis]TWG00210.1 Xre family transcriptional regulator [Kitasatospora viridis]